jgi:hypothetical protein
MTARHVVGWENKDGKLMHTRIRVHGDGKHMEHAVDNAIEGASRVAEVPLGPTKLLRP